MNTIVIRLGLLSGVACAALWLPLAPDAQPAGEARASIMFGTFLTDRQSTTRLDSDSGSGTDIDMEDDLGLESSTSVARSAATFGSVNGIASTAPTSICHARRRYRSNETIEFGDETFPINTVVETESDLTIIKADYTFAIVARDRGWFGVRAVSTSPRPGSR